MKKTLATIIGICGIAAYVNAQGTFIVDSSVNSGTTSSATTGGLVWLDPDGGSVANATLDTGTDINLAVLWGTSAGAVNTVLNLDPLNLNSPGNTSWLASKATGASDITFLGNGAIVDPNGNNYIVPGAAAGSTIFLQMFGWTGSATSFQTATGLKGQTGVFSIVLGNNSNPVQPDVSGMSALVLSGAVPEPSIFALGGLGAAALMAVRRRK